MLVLEKGGKVRKILNGLLQEEPLIELSVDSINERGLLGVAAAFNELGNNQSSKRITVNNSEPGNKRIDVFLYFTELLSRTASSSSSPYTLIDSASEQIRNRVYKYEWLTQNLTNPELILDLPALPGPNHNGGKIAIGPDNYLNVVIGDLNRHRKLQNYRNGAEPDDTGVILRINPDKREDNASYFDDNKDNVSLSNTDIENAITETGNTQYNISHRYHAYGIRNSFGIAFDPVAGSLWETENGFTNYDEINVINPGFNGGWQAIMGPLSKKTGDIDAESILR